MTKETPQFDRWCIAIDQCETISQVQDVSNWFKPYIKDYGLIYVEFFIEHRNKKIEEINQVRMHYLQKNY